MSPKYHSKYKGLAEYLGNQFIKSRTSNIFFTGESYSFTTLFYVKLMMHQGPHHQLARKKPSGQLK